MKATFSAGMTKVLLTWALVSPLSSGAFSFFCGCPAHLDEIPQASWGVITLTLNASLELALTNGVTLVSTNSGDTWLVRSGETSSSSIGTSAPPPIARISIESANPQFAQPPQPALNLTPTQYGFELSWPSTFSNFVPEQAFALQRPSWQRLTNAPTFSNGTARITIFPSRPAAFFRLNRQ
jgi:hypothetical protein